MALPPTSRRASHEEGAEVGEDPPPRRKKKAAAKKKEDEAPRDPLAGVDVQELDAAIEEGRTAGVSENLIEKVLEIRKRVVKSQMGLSAHVALYYVRARHKGIYLKWRQSGGQERLTKATAAGKEAMRLLHEQSECGPLGAATEGLALATSEAMRFGVQSPDVEAAREVLRLLRAAASALEAAHKLLDEAMDAAEDVKSHAQLTKAERLLNEAVLAGVAAYVESTLLRSAETTLRDVRKRLTESEIAEERLAQTIAFCGEHLSRFYAKQRSQLKMVAVPALTSALDLAKSKLVRPEKVLEGEEKLHEALKARVRVEDASQWLSTASKASVRALSSAAGDRVEATHILQVAIDSLASALQGAKDNGVEPDDISSAERILSTLRASQRRTKYRAGLPDSSRTAPRPRRLESVYSVNDPAAWDA